MRSIIFWGRSKRWTINRAQAADTTDYHIVCQCAYACARMLACGQPAHTLDRPQKIAVAIQCIVRGLRLLLQVMAFTSACEQTILIVADLL